MLVRHRLGGWLSLRKAPSGKSNPHFVTDRWFDILGGEPRRMVDSPFSITIPTLLELTELSRPIVCGRWRRNSLMICRKLSMRFQSPSKSLRRCGEVRKT